MFEYAVILFILVVVGYLIFQPLLRPKEIQTLSPQNEEIRDKDLQKRKEDVYAAIKEMDFDFGMGKISEEDYQELKSQYKAKALEIMKELDTGGRGEDIDTAIEREVKGLRKKKKQKRKRGAGKETPRQINFCPQCGSKVDKNHNFCQGCGIALTSSQGGD